MLSQHLALSQLGSSTDIDRDASVNAEYPSEYRRSLDNNFQTRRRRPAQTAISKARLSADRSSERLGRKVYMMDVVLDSNIWPPEALESPTDPAPTIYCAMCTVCNPSLLSHSPDLQDLNSSCSCPDYWDGWPGSSGTREADFLRYETLRIPTSAERSTAGWESEHDVFMYEDHALNGFLELGTACLRWSPRHGDKVKEHTQGPRHLVSPYLILYFTVTNDESFE